MQQSFIKQLEKSQGRRRNDLRRLYNKSKMKILKAGAKINNLSLLNGRRIFHATKTRVITGRIVDGKIVSDAFTTNPGMMQSYKSKIPDPLTAWETSGSVIWIPTNDNTVYTSPSQFCVANWSSDGIARSCNGWREVTTIVDYNAGGNITQKLVSLRVVSPKKMKKMKKKKKKKKKKNKKKVTLPTMPTPDVNFSRYNVNVRVTDFQRYIKIVDIPLEQRIGPQFEYSCTIEFNFPYYNVEEGRKDTYDYNVLYAEDANEDRKRTVNIDEQFVEIGREEKDELKFNQIISNINNDVTLEPKITPEERDSLWDKHKKQLVDEEEARRKDFIRVRNNEVRLKYLNRRYVNDHLSIGRGPGHESFGREIRNAVNTGIGRNWDEEKEHNDRMTLTEVQVSGRRKQATQRSNYFQRQKTYRLPYDRYNRPHCYTKIIKIKALVSIDGKRNIRNTLTRQNRIQQIREFKELVAQAMLLISKSLFLPSGTRVAPMVRNNVVENRFVGARNEAELYANEVDKYYDTYNQVVKGGELVGGNYILRPNYIYKLHDDAILTPDFWRNFLISDDSTGDIDAWNPRPNNTTIRRDQSWYIPYNGESPSNVLTTYKLLEQDRFQRIIGPPTEENRFRQDDQHLKIYGIYKIKPMLLLDKVRLEPVRGNWYRRNMAMAERTFMLQSNTRMPLSNEGFLQHVGIAT